MITSGSTGLTVAQAMALPYLVVDNPPFGYQMNASPPYYSSFLFTDIPGGSAALLPPVNLIPGLLLAVRIWAQGNLKVGQYEGMSVVNGDSLNFDDSFPNLIHIGGTTGITNHVTNSGAGHWGISGGNSFVLLCTGSAWLMLNSFSTVGQST